MGLKVENVELATVHLGTGQNRSRRPQSSARPAYQMLLDRVVLLLDDLLSPLQRHVLGLQLRDLLALRLVGVTLAAQLDDVALELASC